MTLLREGKKGIKYKNLWYWGFFSICCVILELNKYLLKGRMFMASIEAIKLKETSNDINVAMEILFSKLDEAIDDMENGRVLTEEEIWAEIDAI